MGRVLANSFDRMWSACQTDFEAAVARVGASGWFILGTEVTAFEAELASWSGAKAAVSCGNGMDAIEIALRLHGIGAGQKVLTTPLSAFATSLAILRAGAEPVYCDVDVTGQLDPDAAEQAFATHRDIAAILPVHLYGHLADIAALEQIADCHGAVVIEDAAQAIGAKRGKERVGGRNHMACFSFYPTKNLGAIGDGGALLLSDEALAERARALRNYGQTERYVHDELGMNSRLDELHAATLRSAFLPRLEGWLDARRSIARRYLDGITTAAVTTVPGHDPNGAGWHLFPVLVAPERRDAFMAYLGDADIQTGIHYPKLILDQKAVTERGAPLVCGALTNATHFADSEVSLPIHPYLTDAEVDHVIAAVNTWTG